MANGKLLTLKQRLAAGIAKEKAAKDAPAPDVQPQPSDDGFSAVEMIQNVPGSAMQFGEDIAQMVVNPSETFGGLANLGKGVIQKLARHLGGTEEAQKYEPYADAIGEFFSERYGGWDKIMNTLETDPIGSIADLSMLVSGGGTAAARLPGMAGKIGRGIQTVGSKMDPLSAVGGAGKFAVEKFAEPVVSHLVGKLAGTGAEPIREAARVGAEGGDPARIFLENLRGTARPEGVIDSARSAIAKMISDRNKDYLRDMKALGRKEEMIDFGPIDDAFREVADRGVYRGASGGGKPLTVRPGTDAVWKEMADAIDEWRAGGPDYHTAIGIDQLKQRIGVIKDRQAFRSPERALADQVYATVRKQIVDQAPEYDRIMRDYSTMTDTVVEFERALGIGGAKAAQDTAFRKLTAIMRNNVSANYAMRLKMGQQLDELSGRQILPAIAGQSLSAGMPRGLAGSGTQVGGAALAGSMVNPAFYAAIPASSPRIVGETAYYGGKAQGLLNQGARAVGPRMSRGIGRAAYQGGRLQDPLNAAQPLLGLTGF